MTARHQDQDKENHRYIFTLYVAGMNPHSLAALDNVRKICDECLEGNYELKVVDLVKSPEKAKEANVIAAPFLIKELPLPVRKVIGDLSNTAKVKISLEIR